MTTPQLRLALTAAWLVAGALTGLGLSEVFSRQVLLLLPAAMLAAYLAWQLGLTREAAGFVIGLSALPFTWAGRAAFDGAACQVEEGLDVCTATPAQPGIGLILGFVMLAAGIVLLRRGTRIRTTSPA